MYKLLLAIIVVLIANQLHAQPDPVNVLADVNAEWLNQPEAKQLKQVPLADATNHQQCISLHLKLIEQVLRQRDVSHLSSIQKRNRTHLLDELNSYQKAGIYPVNDYLPYKNPVFIDRNGTHCAVGYLMMQSGHDELAQQINRNEKFAYIHEIKTTGVAEWANECGFTIDELAWIQPTYMPATKFNELENGPNGPVDFLNTDNYNKLIIAGRFDSLNNLPCLGIGCYRGGQLECLGGGLNGTIAGVGYHANKVAALGALQHNGTSYPIAIFDTGWNYINIPGKENAIVTCSSNSLGLTYVEVAIRDTTQQNLQEIWQLSGNMLFTHKASFYGQVNSINIYDQYAVYAGHFDSVLVAAGNHTIAVHNVIVYNRYQQNWFAIPYEVSDTVSVVKVIGSTIYIGGVCSNDSGRSNICLTRYLNGVLQPLAYYYPLYPHYNNHSEVLAISEYDNGMLLGGEFDYDGSIACKNLSLLETATGYNKSYGFMDGKVKTVASYNGDMYIGGDFTKYNNFKQLRYLARVDNTTGISETDNSTNLGVYPNPAQNEITITIHEGVEVFQTVITDMTGREVLTVTSSSNSNAISIAELAPGVYILKVFTGNGTATARFVKQ